MRATGPRRRTLVSSAGILLLLEGDWKLTIHAVVAIAKQKRHLDARVEERHKLLAVTPDEVTRPHEGWEIPSVSAMSF